MYHGYVKHMKGCHMGDTCAAFIIIIHYVINFVSDLRQVGGFLWFHPPFKLTATI